jgi:hypothetical protein
VADVVVDTRAVVVEAFAADGLADELLHAASPAASANAAPTHAGTRAIGLISASLARNFESYSPVAID